MRRSHRRSLKQRVYRWLYRGLLSLAVGAALYVVIADQLTAAQWGQATVRYSRATAQMSAAAISRQRQMAISYNAMVRRRQQGDETARSAYRYRQILWLDAQGTMATLTIPAIHLKMPIRHGTDAHTLEQGIGHWPRSSLPIGGMSNRPIITGRSKSLRAILWSGKMKQPCSPAGRLASIRIACWSLGTGCLIILGMSTSLSLFGIGGPLITCCCWG